MGWQLLFSSSSFLSRLLDDSPWQLAFLPSFLLLFLSSCWPKRERLSLPLTPLDCTPRFLLLLYPVAMCCLGSPLPMQSHTSNLSFFFFYQKLPPTLPRNKSKSRFASFFFMLKYKDDVFVSAVKGTECGVLILNLILFRELRPRFVIVRLKRNTRGQKKKFPFPVTLCSAVLLVTNKARRKWKRYFFFFFKKKRKCQPSTRIDQEHNKRSRDVKKGRQRRRHCIGIESRSSALLCSLCSFFFYSVPQVPFVKYPSDRSFLVAPPSRELLIDGVGFSGSGLPLCVCWLIGRDTPVHMQLLPSDE